MWITSLEKIPPLLGKTIVGRFSGKIVSAPLLFIWIEDNWKVLLGYNPTFHTLARGWLVFKFRNKEYLVKIFNQEWS
jgi:hypothetical protein